MDIDLVFRIAAIGIIISVLDTVLTKSGRDELAMLTTLSGLIIVLTMVVKEIVTFFNTIKTMFNL